MSCTYQPEPERTDGESDRWKRTHPTAATLLPAALAEGAEAEAVAAAAARAAALYIIAPLSLSLKQTQSAPGACFPVQLVPEEGLPALTPAASAHTAVLSLLSRT